MNSNTIDRNYEAVAIVQSLIFLYGAFTSIRINLQLGWEPFYFFLIIPFVGLCLLNCYFLYRYHKKSATIALFIWLLQLFKFDFASFSLSFHFGVALYVGIESLKINIIALPISVWIIFLKLRQNKFATD